MVRSDHLKSYKSEKSFPFAKSFGQKEELVTRLKNINQEYSGKIDVFKELIQNADDAGASKFHLVFDKRTHGSERVFNENCKFIQGPALMAFNDRVFLEKDYEGLSKLGIGSKREEEDVIGKFGIGFNTVYSITDTPMFISNEDFVIFDPHLQFSEVGTSEEPGGMFKICPEFEHSYRDIMAGF